MGWWGRDWGVCGWSLLGYEWVYVPFCKRLMNIDPWSLTTYGLILLGIAVALNIFQVAVDMRPARRA